MKTAELVHLYFKPGDDLAQHLANTTNPAEALEAFARQMEWAAKTLRSIKDIVTGHEVQIAADVHYIGITGPDEVIDRLVTAGLAEIDELEEDDPEFHESDGGDEPLSQDLDREAGAEE